MSFPLTFEPSGENAFKPQLAYFPNGPPPPGVLESPSDLKMSLWKNSKKRGSEVLVAETPKMVYSCQGGGDNVSKYFVAVYNRSSGKVRLVEASPIYKLQQSLKGFNPSLPTSKNLNYSEQRRFLLENFASKKKKQEVKSKLANIVTKEGVSKGASISETIKEQAEKQEKKKIVLREDLPHYDAATQNVQEIYPLDYIITQEELELFSAEANELLAATADPDKLAAIAASNLYGEYVVAHLKAGLKATEEERKKLALLLTFVAHLMSFRKFAAANRRTGYFIREVTQGLPDLPEAVARRFVDTFCIPTRPGGDRFKTDKEKEVKMINYILIVCLTVDQFILDTREIARDLKMQPQQCALHLMAIGCRRAKSNKKGEDGQVTPVLQLKAPLQFPEPRVGKKKAS